MWRMDHITRFVGDCISVFLVPLASPLIVSMFSSLIQSLLECDISSEFLIEFTVSCRGKLLEFIC